LLELRAANELARLWAASGEHDRARRLLEPLHGWFVEGFSLPDVAAARKLLADLA
jgi:hypothetical protein